MADEDFDDMLDAMNPNLVQVDSDDEKKKKADDGDDMPD